MNTFRIALTAAACAVLVVGCAESDTPAPQPFEHPPVGELPPGHAPIGELPAGHPPVGHPPVGQPPGDAPAPEPSGLAFTAPPGWVAETPSSSMRKAQFKLPRAEGDDADGSVVVFHFGGGDGGGVEANFKRWATQFEQADGSSSRDAATFAEREVSGMKVHLMDVSGRYVAETRPGSGVRVDQPDRRMIAAIVESGHGAYFVKAVGPAATLAKWADSIHAYVDSARP